MPAGRRASSRTRSSGNGWLHCAADPELDLRHRHRRQIREGAEQDRHRSRHAVERSRARVARLIRARRILVAIARAPAPVAARLARTPGCCASDAASRARARPAHRLAEDEALRVFAAELIELDRIGVGLGAFGDDVHAEIVRQRDDRAQDDRARALAVVRTNDWSILIVSNGKRCR